MRLGLMGLAVLTATAMACSGSVLIDGGLTSDKPSDQVDTDTDHPPDDDGPADLPQEDTLKLPPDAATVEVVTFDEQDAAVSMLDVKGGSSIPLPALATTNLISVFDAAGELLHSEMMTATCPHWSGESKGFMHVVPSQYPTIQDAIDAAGYGDTVFVQPGTYAVSLKLRSGIRLLGAGPWQTQLVPAGASLRTVDFSGAHDVVIRGFRFSNGALSGGCASDDVFECSGDWYSVALYADGHESELSDHACHPTSALITQNVFDSNGIAFMAYFHPQVVLRNNVFANNPHAVVMNHHQDHALLLNNSIYNSGMAVGLQATFTHASNNIVSDAAIGIEQHYVQLGAGGCNIVHDAPVDSGLGSTIISNADPLFAAPAVFDMSLALGSPAFDVGCAGIDKDGSLTDAGATGGLYGWSAAP